MCPCTSGLTTVDRPPSSRPRATTLRPLTTTGSLVLQSGSARRAHRHLRCLTRSLGGLLGVDLPHRLDGRSIGGLCPLPGARDRTMPARLRLSLLLSLPDPPTEMIVLDGTTIESGADLATVEEDRRLLCRRTLPTTDLVRSDRDRLRPRFTRTDGDHHRPWLLHRRTRPRSTEGWRRSRRRWPGSRRRRPSRGSSTALLRPRVGEHRPTAETGTEIGTVVVSVDPRTETCPRKVCIIQHLARTPDKADERLFPASFRSSPSVLSPSASPASPTRLSL